ncbi:MAG: glycosyltransferase [Bacteroidales bacterium]|jgi:glycosyltransferase involved in cell wall biosynthesis|nr:glycosyltransferase [Bacteroidales bacterium]
MKKVIVSVTNDLVTDQRVQRVCKTLHDNSYNIVLIGRIINSEKCSINLPYKTKRFKLLFKKGFLFYACFNIRLFFYLLFAKADVFLSNDLDTLPANYFASRIRHKSLVYDSHELFTEVPELINRPKIKNIWARIEKKIIPQLKNCYTVSKPIALYYKDLYNIDFAVIRNLPKKYTDYKNIAKRERLLIYQGALNIGRGLESLITAIQFVDNVKLIIAGQGDIEHSLYKLCKKYNLDNKIKFIGRVNPKELQTYTKQAILGFSLEEDMGLNYRYALPNKIFDYIQAGVPILVSALPEMGKIVETYKVGETFTGKSSVELAQQINGIINSTDKLNLYHNNSQKASIELNWEIESKKILDIFNRLV